MDTAQTTSARSPRRRSMLPRGESLIASVGISAMVILLAVMTAAGWWMLHLYRDALGNSQREAAGALGRTMVPSIESMLAAGELSAVRRMIVEAGRQFGLQRCRIRLPDGGVVADAEPTKITIRNLPDRWSDGLVDSASPPAVEDTISLRFPLSIPGRGAATLDLTAAAAMSPLGQWEMAAVAGSMTAGGLVGLLLLYRRMRRRLLPLGLIREALLATRTGESMKDALAICGTKGPETEAWNELVAEMDRLRQHALTEQAREALGPRREGRSDLANACDALPQGLIILDDRALVQYANGAAAIFLQCKREDLSGNDISALVPYEAVREAIIAAISGTARQRKTVEVERKDEMGSGVLRFAVRPLRRNDGSSVLITIDDITQQRIAADSRSSFVAQATHELRMPLSNIRLYLETALADGENDPAIRTKCLNVINTEARRLERMVGEMLSMSEIEAGSLKVRRDDVRLDKLFEELADDYNGQAAEKGITLTFNLPPKLPVIQADRDKLIVAVHNLIGNALKYTPKGGRVTVEVRPEPNRLVVDVIDTGIGIAEQEQPLIFEKFYRAKDPRVGKITGSGLGLALARDVIRLHGGDITVHSEMNNGSTFSLMLPVLKEAA